MSIFNSLLLARDVKKTIGPHRSILNQDIENYIFAKLPNAKIINVKTTAIKFNSHFRSSSNAETHRIFERNSSVSNNSQILK